MFGIQLVDDFLDKQSCNKILDSIKNEDLWINGVEGFWKNRSIDVKDFYLYNRDISNMLLTIKEKIAEQLKINFDLKSDVYADLIQVIRWMPGMEQHPHCDDMTDTNNKNLEWFKHRDFGCILYLNDNYDGGKTYYPQHGIEVVPKTGRLAMHKGTPEYMHGVTKIEDNIRYTIASFWTFEKGYEHDWSIYK